MAELRKQVKGKTNSGFSDSFDTIAKDIRGAALDWTRKQVEGRLATIKKDIKKLCSKNCNSILAQEVAHAAGSLIGHLEDERALE